MCIALERLKAEGIEQGIEQGMEKEVHFISMLMTVYRSIQRQASKSVF